MADEPILAEVTHQPLEQADTFALPNSERLVTKEQLGVTVPATIQNLEPANLETHVSQINQLLQLGAIAVQLRSNAMQRPQTETGQGILAKVFKQVVPRRLTTSDLMRRESQIGAQLFGEVPLGNNRDFFCLDQNTWVWHEGWKDEAGGQISVATRYEIHPDRIIKVQDGQPNKVLDVQEASRLLLAAQWYNHLVAKHLYGINN